MTNIEKCVCGGEAGFLDPHLECPSCGRAGWNVERWNHDMRGLRLLRELVAIRDRALLSGMIYTGKESRELVDLMQRADAWAEEGDRE